MSARMAGNIRCESQEEGWLLRAGNWYRALSGVRYLGMVKHLFFHVTTRCGSSGSLPERKSPPP